MEYDKKVTLNNDKNMQHSAYVAKGAVSNLFLDLSGVPVPERKIKIEC